MLDNDISLNLFSIRPRIKLWSAYENIIYRFVYGDFLTARPSMNRYAKPMTKDFWKDYQKLKEYDQLNIRDIHNSNACCKYISPYQLNFEYLSSFIFRLF